jgi:hypothetical protein
MAATKRINQLSRNLDLGKAGTQWLLASESKFYRRGSEFKA